MASLPPPPTPKSILPPPPPSKKSTPPPAPKITSSRTINTSLASKYIVKPSGPSAIISGGYIVGSDTGTQSIGIRGVTGPSGGGRLGASRGGSRSSGGSGPSVPVDETTGTRTDTGEQVMSVAPKPTPPPPPKVIKTGGLVDIGSGKSDSAFKPQTGVQTIDASGVIAGQGVSQVTDEAIIKSLESKGIQLNKLTGLEQQRLIEQERAKLSAKAMTLGERSRAESYFSVLSAFDAAVLAPVTLGTGLIGTTASALARLTGLTAVGVPAAKGASAAVTPSVLSEDEQIKRYQDVEKSVKERVSSEGLNLPFLTPQQEKDITTFQLPFIGSIADNVFNLPGGKVFAIPKAQQEYEKTGLSPTEAQAEVQREFLAASVGEFAALVFGAQGIGEIGGAATQKGINILTKASEKTFTSGQARLYGAISGGIGSSVGGFLEGAVTYPFFQRGRYKEINPTDWVNTAVASSIVAGVAGVGIGSFTGKETAQKTIYGGLSVLEGGQEYFGDFSAKLMVGDALESGLKIAGKGEVKVPSTTMTFVQNLFNFGASQPSPTIIDVTGSTKSKSSTNTPASNIMEEFKAPIGGLNPSNALTVNKDLTLVDTTTFTPTTTDTGTVTDEYTFQVTPSKSDNFVNDLTITNTNTNNFTENIVNNLTETNTSTQTFTESLTPTLTSTFKAPFPPLVPFGLNAGSGKGSLRKRTSGKYYDELAAAKSLFKEFQTQQKPFTAKRPSVAKKPTKPFTPEITFAPFTTSKKKNKQIDFTNIFNTSKKGRFNVFNI